MLAVSAQAIGRRKPICDPFSVPPLTTGTAALRDLIAHVVRAEVAAFRTRQADRRLLAALTATQIDAGLAAGKVSAGGSDLDQRVDPDAAAATAVEAFADGLYLVLVDGVEVKSLDAPVTLTASSALLFVRLTLLAGG